MPFDTLFRSALISCCALLSTGVEADAGERPLFEGVHAVFGARGGLRAATFGEFTAEGPNVDTLTPLPRKIRAVVRGAGATPFFALSHHDVGTLDANSETFTELPAPEYGRPSGLRGLEYTPDNRRLWLTSEDGSGGYLHAYDVQRKKWKRFHMGQTRLYDLAWSKTHRSFYGFPHVIGGSLVDELVRINAKGAVVGSLKLSRGIPAWLSHASFLQMSVRGGEAFVLISHEKKPVRQAQYCLWKVDLGSGRTSLLPYDQENDPARELWPGLPKGPPPSDVQADCCLEGKLSNYALPAKVTKQQAEELHVVSVLRGNVQALRDLARRVERLEVSSRGVAVELNLGKETPMAPVEVILRKSRKPFALYLYSGGAVEWKLVAKGSTELKRVWLVGNEASKLSGLPRGVELIDKTGKGVHDDYRDIAHAWELEHNPRGAFDRFIRKVRDVTRLTESSFQGCRAGKRFEVPR